MRATITLRAHSPPSLSHAVAASTRGIAAPARDVAAHLRVRVQRSISFAMAQRSDDKENEAPDVARAARLEALVTQLPVPTMRYTDRFGPATQLLHMGESARSLFMLEKATERRLRLVLALKDAPRSAVTWLELLRCPVGGRPGKYNQIRLLRRALTCTDSTAARASAAYTEMCIMLAKLSE